MSAMSATEQRTVEYRHQIVVELTAQGHSSRSIQGIIGISHTTVARDLAYAKRRYVAGTFVPVNGGSIPKDWENETAAVTHVPAARSRTKAARTTGVPSLDVVLALARERLGDAAVQEAARRGLAALEADLKRMLEDVDAQEAPQ